MPEKYKFRVAPPGSTAANSRTVLTLEKATDLIKKKGYPNEMEVSLIKAINNRPAGSYEDFLKNIYYHMNRIQDAKNKEREINGE